MIQIKVIDGENLTQEKRLEIIASIKERFPNEEVEIVPISSNDGFPQENTCSEAPIIVESSRILSGSSYLPLNDGFPRDYLHPQPPRSKNSSTNCTSRTDATIRKDRKRNKNKKTHRRKK